MLGRDAAARETARLARTTVVEYYNHCWDDYRILWRTDKNASVHFGFFDRSATSADARFPRQRLAPDLDPEAFERVLERAAHLTDLHVPPLESMLRA